MAAGVKVTLTVRETYKNLVNNLTMVRRFGAHLESLGRVPAETDPEMGAGSTDMGDVSQVIPSIHPYVSIGPKALSGHTVEFREAALSERGLAAMVAAAKAMALTAYDVLSQPELMTRARRDFNGAAAARN